MQMADWHSTSNNKAMLSQLFGTHLHVRGIFAVPGKYPRDALVAWEIYIRALEWGSEREFEGFLHRSRTTHLRMNIPKASAHLTATSIDDLDQTNQTRQY